MELPNPLSDLPNEKAMVSKLRVNVFAKAEIITREVIRDQAVLASAQKLIGGLEWLQTIEYLIGDLLAYSLKDPASHYSPDTILKNYVTFESIIHYRLARFFANNIELNDNFELLHAFANRGKAVSGVDINPMAEIGFRFVIDHGFGTVIGETCVIGDDCYILGGVVLGSLSIASSPVGKRHPSIGNNVEIGGFASILGNITVGDNSFISPHCVVTNDVPENSKVIIINQLQVTRLKNGTLNNKKTQVFGLLPSDSGCVIYGWGFSNPSVEVVDSKFRALPEFKLTISKIKLDKIFIEYAGFNPHAFTNNRSIHLSVNDNGDSLVILSPFTRNKYVVQQEKLPYQIME